MNDKKLAINSAKKVLVESTGCISNLIEGSSIENFLKKSGYEIAEDRDEADIIILNTCAFNQKKEDEAIELIKNYNNSKGENIELIVAGCLPSINKERLREFHDGPVVNPKNIDELEQILDTTVPYSDFEFNFINYQQFSTLKKMIYTAQKALDSFPIVKNIEPIKRLLAPFFIYQDDLYFIPIERGCMGNCAYCAIRFAKGKTKSRTWQEIKDTFQDALSKGFSKFVLTGDEISSYGVDLAPGVGLIKLIKYILSHDIDTLYLESLEPGYFIKHFEELKEILKLNKIPVLCSSVQSGSQKILDRMNRDYSIEAFRECILDLQDSCPQVTLRGEIIVGFPGENDEDFRKTMGLIRDLNFDFIDVYEYEDRPNTPASRMSGKVADEVKATRRKKALRRHYLNHLKGLNEYIEKVFPSR